MSKKILAVIELETNDLDLAEEFMQDLFKAGADYGYVRKDYDFYLMGSDNEFIEVVH